MQPRLIRIAKSPHFISSASDVLATYDVALGIALAVVLACCPRDDVGAVAGENGCFVVAEDGLGAFDPVRVSCWNGFGGGWAEGCLQVVAFGGCA